MIKNINSAFGEPVLFENVEEMESAIKACGYSLPEDGLKRGRDYCLMHKVEFESSGWQDGSGWSYTTNFAPTEYTDMSKEEAASYYSIEMEPEAPKKGYDIKHEILFDGEVLHEIWQSEINEEYID